MPAERIQRLSNWVQDGALPEFTLLLDAPIKVAMRRLRHRAHDRIEQAPLAFFERVRQAYLARAHAEPKRFCVIDASQRLPDVKAAIRQALVARLPLGADHAS